jgi:hypothetical protein
MDISIGKIRGGSSNSSLSICRTVKFPVRRVEAIGGTHTVWTQLRQDPEGIREADPPSVVLRINRIYFESGDMEVRIFLGRISILTSTSTFIPSV